MRNWNASVDPFYLWNVGWDTLSSKTAIRLHTPDGGLGNSVTRISNRVSINMTPFKRLIIYGASRYYRGDSWARANASIRIWKANRTTQIKTINIGGVWESIIAMIVDISDVNEHAYFQLIVDPDRSDVYAENNVGFIVSQIDFLTT